MLNVIDTVIAKFFSMRRLAQLAVLALIAIFAYVLLTKSEESLREFKCDNAGLAVVVSAETDNSAWLIAEKYCTGNVGAATDALVERYGDTLYPGQIIQLP